jgi:hypothetical protein
MSAAIVAIVVYYLDTSVAVVSMMAEPVPSATGQSQSSYAQNND